MPDSQDPKQVNNDLRNAQFGGGLINADIVNARRIGSNVYNFYNGQQAVASDNPAQSQNQRQRSQQERDSLEKSYTLQSQKVASIRNAWVIETDPSRKFQYEQQLQVEERTLRELGDKLLAIEQQLLELDNQQTKTDTSIYVERPLIENKYDNATMQPRALIRNAPMTQFDVFLAYNTQDKPQIRAISLALKQRNIKYWIDEEQIPPGRFFQEEIQKAISSVKSAAIFIGSQGIGKWQNWELKAFISQCVEKKIPVIPVLLPDVNNLPEDLVFLKELRWVVFSNRIDDENALDLLEWGITEKKPKNREKLEQEERPGRIPTQGLITSISDLSPEQRERLQQERNLLYILTQSLNTCSNDNELHLYKTTIDTALRRCNPQGSDRSWQQQLEDLSNHPAPIGWETEGKLVYFVMMLAWMKNTPTSTLEELKTWVERWEYSGHKYKYSDLFVRIDDEMRQKKISPSNECECVMVAIEQVETSTDQLRVSLWAVPNLETYNPHKPPMPIISEEVLPRQELPKFVRKKIRDKLRKEPTPTIHLFVSRFFFDDDFEMLTSSNFGAVLGSEYPFVVRTNLKTHPIGWYYYDDWHEKWEQIEKVFKNKTCKVAKFIDCSLPENDLISELEKTCAVILKNCDSVGSWFDLIAEETALPVALWSRNTQFQDQLANVLDGIFKDLPDRIYQERKTAHESKIESLLGHYLSLLWEDPKIVPPDMQFNPEMF